ncbi:MAG: hypothetical protein WA006_08550 [Rhodoglobus sp.]
MTAEEVADIVAFLCSYRAAAIAGDAITVGGGQPGAREGSRAALATAMLCPVSHPERSHSEGHHDGFVRVLHCANECEVINAGSPRGTASRQGTTGRGKVRTDAAATEHDRGRRAQGTTV